MMSEYKKKKKYKKIKKNVKKVALATAGIATVAVVAKGTKQWKNSESRKIVNAILESFRQVATFENNPNNDNIIDI